jgi:hypothetical protein
MVGHAFREFGKLDRRRSGSRLTLSRVQKVYGFILSIKVMAGLDIEKVATSRVECQRKEGSKSPALQDSNEKATTAKNSC